MAEKRMVVCWRCAEGMLARAQGSSTDQGSLAVCLLAKMVIRDPFNPPKVCPVRKGWEAEDKR